MAIPSDPTVTSVVTEGLKRGGRVSPSATQITDAIEHQLREVRADITQRSSRHQVLETHSISVLTNGVSRYAWPTDADDIRSMVLLSCPSEGKWTGLAQTGGANSITLHADFDQDDTVVTGKFIILASGTGSGQFAQIASYNNTSKFAATDTTWTTQPTSATTYFIATHHQKLYTFDKPWGFDTLSSPYQRGTPTRATMVGRQAWLDIAPDQPTSAIAYIVLWNYWANLDRLDEAGTVFIRHLRDYRSLWVQGIAVKTMQRYDEDRYQLELQVYNNMLDAYAGVAAGVGQVNFTDV